MVAGKAIDLAAVSAFVNDAVLLIAHEARFDRPFCERLFPEFADKYWACSNTQVDWAARGHRGTKLTYLLNDFGYFYDGHRALDDCYAVLEVLSAQVRDAVDQPSPRCWKMHVRPPCASGPRGHPSIIRMH